METKKIQLEILERLKESEKNNIYTSIINYVVDQFIKDNNLKPSIEVGKVYKREGTNVLIFVTDADKHLGYGFNGNGMWIENGKWGFESLTEATEQEWQSRLEQYAETLGYNHEEPNYKCMEYPDTTFKGKVNMYYVEHNGFGVSFLGGDCNKLMLNGVWAKTFEKSDNDKKVFAEVWQKWCEHKTTESFDEWLHSKL